MRRQRFPFIIGPREGKAPEDASAADAILEALARQDERMSSVLASLALIESSLEELGEKGDGEGDLRELFRGLLPVLDGMDAVVRAMESGGDPSWKKGMEMLSDRLTALLGARGLIRSARVGMAFDPSRHESVGVHVTPGVAPGTIAEVVESGWLHKGNVFRYAKVVVVKGDA
jgi:molecular chaperone GrpE